MKRYLFIFLLAMISSACSTVSQIRDYAATNSRNDNVYANKPSPYLGLSMDFPVSLEGKPSTSINKDTHFHVQTVPDM